MSAAPRLRRARPATAPPGASACPVVLVHGIGMSHLSFTRLARSLRKSRELIAVDLAGYAGRPGPRRPMGVEGHAAALATELERLGTGSFDVVGQSMGAQIAVQLAWAHPSLVRSVVLIGPVVDDRRRSAWQQFAALLRDTLGESPRMNAIVLFDYLRGIRQYLVDLPSMLAYPTLERLAGLAELAVPVLIVRGRRDPVARDAWVRRLTTAAAGASLVEPAGPHHVQDHAPQAVAAAISAFLDSQEGRP